MTKTIEIDIGHAAGRFRCMDEQPRLLFSLPPAVRRAGLRRYGLEPHEYAALLRRQGGGCAVCGMRPVEPAGRLVVDHDHRTGEVRGLLCHGCNTGLGLLGDDPARLLQAVAYLRPWWPPLDPPGL